MGYPVQNNLRDIPFLKRIGFLKDIVKAQITNPFPNPQNYLEWCLGQYGNSLTDTFYKKYTNKYWRTPMTQLSTDWLSGRLLPSQFLKIILNSFIKKRDRQAVFSSFRYPKSYGFFGFFKDKYEGLSIQYNHKVTEIDWQKKTIVFENGRTAAYEHCVSSMPVTELIQCIKDVPQSVRHAASLLKATQLLCVNIVVNRPQLTPKHWFYIYDQDIPASRVSIPTNLLYSQ